MHQLGTHDKMPPAPKPQTPSGWHCLALAQYRIDNNFSPSLLPIGSYELNKWNVLVKSIHCGQETRWGSRGDRHLLSLPLYALPQLWTEGVLRTNKAPTRGWPVQRKCCHRR